MKSLKRILTLVAAMVMLWAVPVQAAAIDPAAVSAVDPAALQAAAEQMAALQAAQAAAVQDAAVQVAQVAAVPALTFVDVNLTAQTVSYVLNGQIIWASPCVSGDVTDGHATPVGVYSIKTKTPGKRLVGDTWDVWVDYWMRFTDDAIGLHDATWRRNFGGNIYITNGSHGCVNLPHEAAAQLYYMVDIGTQVMVHY